MTPIFDHLASSIYHSSRLFGNGNRETNLNEFIDNEWIADHDIRIHGRSLFPPVIQSKDTRFTRSRYWRGSWTMYRQYIPFQQHVFTYIHLRCLSCLSIFAFVFLTVSTTISYTLLRRLYLCTLYIFFLVSIFFFLFFPSVVNRYMIRLGCLLYLPCSCWDCTI